MPYGAGASIRKTMGKLAEMSALSTIQGAAHERLHEGSLLRTLGGHVVHVSATKVQSRGWGLSGISALMWFAAWLLRLSAAGREAQ